MHGAMWVHSDQGRWASVFVIATLCVALSDLCWRRVDNRLALSILGMAYAYWFLHAGFTGLGASLMAGSLSFLVFLPLYVVGATGAGDVKIMTAYGALVGPAGLASLYLTSALFAGLLGLVALWSMKPYQVLVTLRSCLRPRGALQRARASKQTMPLTVALSSGALTVLMGRF
jgi:Flp pilus assembly protein protease CpaA